MDVLKFLSIEFVAIPLGLAKTYAATLCEQIASANPQSNLECIGSLVAQPCSMSTAVSDLFYIGNRIYFTSTFFVGLCIEVIIIYHILIVM